MRVQERGQLALPVSLLKFSLLGTGVGRPLKSTLSCNPIFDFIPLHPFYCPTDRGLTKTQIPNYRCLAPIGTARAVRLYEQEPGEPFRSPLAQFVLKWRVWLTQSASAE